MNRRNVLMKVLSILLSVVMIATLIPMNLVIGLATGDVPVATDSDADKDDKTPDPDADNSGAKGPTRAPVDPPITKTITIVDGNTNSPVGHDAVSVTADNGTTVTPGANDGEYTLSFTDDSAAVTVSVSDAKSDDLIVYADAQKEYAPAEGTDTISLTAQYKVKVIGAGKTVTSDPMDYNTSYTILGSDYAADGYQITGLLINGSSVSCDNDNKDKAITVTGPVTAQYTYNKSITVSVSGNKGTVSLGGSSISGSATRLFEENASVTLYVSPDKGHKISYVRITTGGSTSDYAANSTTSFETAIVNPAEVVVVFAPIEYTGVKVKLINTTAQAYSVKLSGTVTTADAHLAAPIEVAVGTIGPDSAGNHYVNIQNFTIPEANYKLYINGEEQKDSTGKPITNGSKKVPVTGNGQTVTLELKPVDYTLTFIDPVAGTTTTQTVTCETASVTPPAGTTETGWTLKGWVKADPSDDGTSPLDLSQSAVASDFNGPFTENCTYYAVYKFTGVQAKYTAKAICAYNNTNVTKEYNTATNSDEISSVWFSGDVTLTIGNISGLTATVKDGNGNTYEPASDEYKFAIADTETVKIKNVAVTVSYTQEKTYESRKYVYGAETADSFAVKIDKNHPYIEIVDSTYSWSQKTNTDTISFNDNDASESGFASLKYTVLDLSAAGNEDFKTYLEDPSSRTDATYDALKQKFGALSETVWSDSDLTFSSGQATYTHETYNDSETNNKVVVYRVLDNAGNAWYSFLDVTKPEITTTSQLASTYSNADGIAYADGTSDIVVTATVKDRNIADYKKSGYTYTGATLVVTDSAGNTLDSFVLGSSDGCTSVKASFIENLFADTYDCTFTIPASKFASLKNQPLTLTVIARDQAGNEATPVKLNEKLVIASDTPAITFDPATATISKEDVSVGITVEADYFMVDGLTAPTVTVTGTAGTYTVSWSEQSRDKWVGTVTVHADAGVTFDETLSVTATGASGNSGTATSAVITVDKTAPTISAQYSYQARDNDVDIDADGNATLKTYTIGDSAIFYFNKAKKVNVTITVEDTNRSADADDYTVTLDGAVTSATWNFDTAGKAIGTLTIPAGSAEGAHALAVTAKDTAKNQTTYSNSAAHGDGTAPEVTSVKVSFAEQTFFQKVIHTVSGGVFYQPAATVTVVAKDAGSGVNAAVLYFTKLTGKSVDATDDTLYTGTTEVTSVKLAADNSAEYTFTFTVPEVVDPETYRSTNMSLVVCDAAGNTTEKTEYGKLSDATKAFDGETESVVVFENVAPTITGADTWLPKDQAYTATVTDSGTSAGLYSVRTKVNGVLVSSVRVTDETNPTSHTVSIPYATFDQQINTVVITAMDIAGNSAEATYTVYKDAVAPTFTKVGFSGTAGKNIMAHGNYYNNDMTVTVGYSDAAVTAGIASVTATFVVSETESIPLTADTTTFPNANTDAAAAQELSFKLPIADAAGKTGSITIEVTDKAGNKTTYNKDTAITTIENFSKNSVIMDTASPVLSADALTVDDTKDTTYDDAGTLYCRSFSQVDLTFKATDLLAGLREVKLALDGADLEQDLLSQDTVCQTEKTYNYNIGSLLGSGYEATDGLHTVNVTVTDNAGNATTKDYEVYLDTTAPVISGVSMALDPDSQSFWQKALHTIKGIFFGQQVTVTFTATDAVVGIKDVTLKTTGYDSDPVDDENAVSDWTLTPVSHTGDVYTFELPVSSITYWNKELTFTVKDQLGNTTTFTGTEEMFGDFENGVVLYEAVAPTIAEGDNAAASFFTDPDGNRWLKPGEEFAVSVGDGEAGSGLYAVDVLINGAAATEYDFDVSGTDTDKTATYTPKIRYDSLKAGENTINVNAEDNSGNTATATPITLYKDADSPAMANLTVALNEAENILTHGNYSNGGITATVRVTDAAPSSGLADVKVEFVAKDGAIALTTADTPDTAVDLAAAKDQTLVFSADADKVLGKEGYLKITLTDNVGNETVFTTTDGDLSKTNLKNANFRFEDVPATITGTPADGFDVPEVGKTYKSSDIDFTVSVTDKVEGALVSGIRSVATTLNGTVVADASADDLYSGSEAVDDYTETFNLQTIMNGTDPAAVENENEIVVTVTDNAGNVSTATYYVYIDSADPVVTGINLDVKEGKIRNYGNFFRSSAVLTVSAKDEAGVLDSGVKEATLYYKDLSTDEEKNVVSAAVYDEASGTYVIAFTLPVISPSTDLTEWKASLKLSLTDNVGNTTAPVAVTTLAAGSNSMKNDVVLYETTAPVITSSASERDAAVLYLAADEDSTVWLLKDKTFNVTVIDQQAGEDHLFDSGLRQIDVTVTDREGTTKIIYSETVVDDASDNAVYNWSEEIAYDDFTAGMNTVDVVAVDDAGNEAKESYVVYKDEAAPQITKISIAPGEGSNLAYGNFYNGDVAVTLDLLDEEFTAGIASVTAVYVADDGKEYALTETDGASPEGEALTKDALTLTRHFDLAEVVDTTGTLKITVTDNVGNTYEYNKDEAIPEGSDISSQEITFENSASKISETHTDPVYLRGEDECYPTTDIKFTITVNEAIDGATDTNAVKKAGIRSVTTKLNGTAVADATAELAAIRTDKKIYSFNLKDIKDADGKDAAVEGRNEIEVATVDNAGNVATKTYVVYVDETLPTITSLKLEIKDRSEILRTITLGNFFNGKVVMTVVANDFGTCDAGLQSALLTYTDNTVDPAEQKTIENKTSVYDAETGEYTFTFELPLKADDEADLDYWKSELSIAVVDNVDNATEAVMIAELAEGIEDLESSAVLYETQAPNISSSRDNNGGKADDGVLYFEKEDGSYWVFKDTDFAIDVNDLNVKDYDSGLYAVTVSDNGTEMAEYAYSLNEEKGAEYEHHVDFAYDKLTVGKNEIVVTAEDIAGNKTEKTYVVYKDAQAPAVSLISIDEGEGSLLSYGNFFNDGITVTLKLKDEEYSSGISSVSVKYVADDGEAYTLTETDGLVPESSPLTEGTTLIERTFTLPFIQDTTGYLEITVTDNVGNDVVFTKDSEIPEGSDIASTAMMFEQTQLTLDVATTEPDCVRKETVKAEDGSDQEIEKDCYMTDNVVFDITVTDVAEKVSGIRSITTTLNGTVVEEATADLSAVLCPEKVFSFNAGEIMTESGEKATVEGKNEVIIVLTDNAGNTFTETHLFYLDYTLPVITAVKMEKAEGSRVLNLLTFGNFFNDKVILTVVATDKAGICNTGVATATLTYKDYTGKDVADVAIENADVTIDGENHTFTFELPIGKDEDAEEAMAHWRSILSVAVCDGAGNATEPVEIHQLGSEIESFDSAYVLYETEKPNIKTSINSVNGAYDADVLYFDKDGTSTYWVRSGQSFVIMTDDLNVEDYNSGLYSVTISNNGELYSQTKYGYSVLEGEPQTQIFDATFAIAYSDLTEGVNKIVVTAVDNAGNSTTHSVAVFKDVDTPAVTRIDLASTDCTLLSYGCFFHDDLYVTVDARDDAFSSGVATVEVNYVKTTGEVIPLVENENQKRTPETNALTTEEANTLTREFVLALPDHSTGSLEIIVVDNVGNRFVFDKDSEIPAGSNMQNTYLMFETDALSITENDQYGDLGEVNAADPVTERYTCKDDEFTWYKNFNVDVDINVSEPDEVILKSGVKNVTTQFNGVTVDSATGADLSQDDYVYSTDWHFNAGEIVNDENAVVAQEGKNTITVSAIDNAGNGSSFTRDFYVDLTKPVVEKMEAAGKNGSKDVDVFNPPVPLGNGDYGFYFSTDTEITVYVSDAIPSSGLSTVYFALIPLEGGNGTEHYNSDEAVTTCATVATEENEGKISRTAKFTVEAGFKGQVNAYVVDNVGNVSADDVNDISTWMHPDDFILETQAEHNSAEKHVTITAHNTNLTGNLANGTPLYSDNATVTLEVSDLRAGIRSVTCTVTSPYDTANNATYHIVEGSIDNRGSVARGSKVLPYAVGDYVSGWRIDSIDRNLITKLSRTITVANNSNDIEIELSMVDNSGNTSTEKFKLNIDKDAPVITVRYDLASGDDDAEHTGYFNHDRLLTVTIDERNFNPDLVNITATKDGGAYSIGGFSLAGGVQKVENGIESYVYTLTYTFHDDGDYTFAIAATDLATHATSDEQVDYGSEADRVVAKTFTIDETMPVIRAEITGDKGDDIYYNGNVLLTITVEEHNYDPSRYEISITTMDPQSGAVVNSHVPAENYSANGDTHTYTYDFSDEYKFAVASLKVTDKAGNSTTEYQNSEAATTGFIVDQHNPEIQLFMHDAKTALDHTATNEVECGPVIVLTDTNLAHSRNNVSITLTGALHGTQYSAEYTTNYEYVQDPSDPGRDVINMVSFEDDQLYDDIYTIQVSVTDRAGRVSEGTMGSAMFSVNRYGSTFMVSDSTKKLIDKYYTNKEQEVELIQINAAEVSEQSVSLQRDTMTEDLTKDVDYKFASLIPDSAERANAKWYQYEYTLYEQNFEEEGKYAVTVFSKDTADNTITSVTSKRTIYLFTPDQIAVSGASLANTKQENRLEAPVNFQMDTTPPSAYIVGYDDGGNDQKNTATYEIKIQGVDDVMLDRVEMVVMEDKTGTVIDSQSFDAQQILDEEAIYTVSETKSKNYQVIKLTAYDKAGNASTDPEEIGGEARAPYTVNIQVTQNIAKLFWGNTLAKIIAASVLVAGLAFFLILFKRRKDKKEEEDVKTI